ncbi:MAG: 2-C-methyl-D-erythritol 2,4-cyclodiphosphate synthase [bacterium]|nr:2-C-methyl-D-erythritol 2,4-cyclodiphosphate synthase [bacterium]
MSGRARVGLGQDAHRLVAGRELVLGGVRVPYALGLDGHSDADVLAHAIIDALLGAMGDADIGTHFPPGDPAYKDASSLDLLARVGTLIRGRGYVVGNIDATVLADEPRLAPHSAEMRRRLAQALAIEPHQINVKAKTMEGMGFVGRREGLAALAVALLEPYGEDGP